MRLNTALSAIAALSITAAAHADTTQTGPSVYEIDAGVSFSVSNSGASHFLFSWSDASGTFTNIEDPTLILSAGETYTFARTTGSHPLGITDDTLPVSGTDGSFARTTTDIAVIDAAMLQPMDDFIADPAPTTDMISWTPDASEAGDYFYTCRVTFHTGMVGAIQIAGGACSFADCDANGTLNIDDIDCFVAAFLGGDLAGADCDGNGTLNIDDIDCFVASFLAGCP
ncbi:MAG: hypothetical protein RIB60_11325 [Phycisphaerales bacterium]